MSDGMKQKIVFLTSSSNEKLSIEHEFKVLARILQFKYQVSSIDNIALLSPDEILVISAGMENF